MSLRCANPAEHFPAADVTTAAVTSPTKVVCVLCHEPLLNDEEQQ